MVSWCLLLVVVVADAGPLEGFYIDVFVQRVQLSLEKVWTSCGGGWKRKMWFLDENIQDLLMFQWPTNNLATIGGYMFSTVISSPFSRFSWMVFVKAVRLYQCENDLRAITILVTNPFVVKVIWRRPLNLSKMRWCCSKSGVRSTKLSYQYQVSKEMQFFVCHLSSGPLPDISGVMTPRNYRGYKL